MNVDAGKLEYHVKQQIVLVLVGLVGSGKSTFAKALEEHVPIFRRCNQDELGDRRRVEKLARERLQEGFSVCIDRTNIDESQRLHWINIAKEVPGTLIWCLVFDVPVDTCAMRLQSRMNHPTIKSPEQGLMILHRFKSEYQAPSIQEGLDRIFFMPQSVHPTPVYTKADIVSILKQVEIAVPSSAARTTKNPKTTHFFRGSNNRGSSRARNKYDDRKVRQSDTQMNPQDIRSFFQRSQPHRNVKGRLTSAKTHTISEDDHSVPINASTSAVEIHGEGSVQDPIVFEITRQ